jgi:hypothetical protein
MAESYTIESADDSVPIDPKLLRELRDLLREGDDLDLGVSLKDRPPARGEQGAIPVALEIVVAAIPLGKAFADVLTHWIDKNKVKIKLRRKGETVELEAGSVKDVERLIALLKNVNGAQPDDGG